MNNETARHFASQWIESWNRHDLESILSHYEEELEFYSPFIRMLNFNDSGVITKKAELRSYFEIGLKSYPELYFVFHSYFTGINTVVIYYTSVNGRKAAEVFELNEDGKAVKVYCNYTEII